MAILKSWARTGGNTLPRSKPRALPKGNLRSLNHSLIAWLIRNYLYFEGSVHFLTYTDTAYKCLIKNL